MHLQRGPVPQGMPMQGMPMGMPQGMPGVPPTADGAVPSGMIAPEAAAQPQLQLAVPEGRPVVAQPLAALVVPGRVL